MKCVKLEAWLEMVLWSMVCDVHKARESESR